MAINKVLVVDDSPTDSHVMSELLKKNGMTVINASSGEEGIEKAKSENPDLVIMDVVMPGMSGFEATRAIAKGGDTSHIPVIICTTKDQETDKAWGLRQGARDYVTKPITETELMSKIKALK
jgi:twitching motility two-component system response regulator PilH